MKKLRKTLFQGLKKQKKKRKAEKAVEGGFNNTQVISIFSILFSLVSIYYKREEIKKFSILHHPLHWLLILSRPFKEGSALWMIFENKNTQIIQCLTTSL